MFFIAADFINLSRSKHHNFETQIIASKLI